MLNYNNKLRRKRGKVQWHEILRRKGIQDGWEFLKSKTTIPNNSIKKKSWKIAKKTNMASQKALGGSENKEDTYRKWREVQATKKEYSQIARMASLGRQN